MYQRHEVVSLLPGHRGGTLARVSILVLGFAGGFGTLEFGVQRRQVEQCPVVGLFLRNVARSSMRGVRSSGSRSPRNRRSAPTGILRRVSSRRCRVFWRRSTFFGGCGTPLHFFLNSAIRSSSDFTCAAPLHWVGVPRPDSPWNAAFAEKRLDVGLRSSRPRRSRASPRGPD